MAQEPLEEVIPFQIDRTNKVMKLYSQREFDRLGLDITIEQWVLLKIVDERAPISQRELATHSLRDPAAITRTLDLLVKKGYLLRNPMPNNRRQHNIELSSEGQAFVQQNLALIQDMRRKCVEGFSEDEMIFLRRMLLRIQANMA